MLCITASCHQDPVGELDLVWPINWAATSSFLGAVPLQFQVHMYIIQDVEVQPVT